MKIAERIVMVTLVVGLLCGAGWFYWAVKGEQADMREAVARGEFEIPQEAFANQATKDQEDWQAIYPNTVGILIGETLVRASIADTLPKRIKGLSGTPFLPDNVVKLFAFGVPGKHSIWMKDMQYALDILWADKDGLIVHIEEQVSPETYPKSFASPTPAWYVVEAKAGFVAQNNIALGDEVVLPVAE